MKPDTVHRIAQEIKHRRSELTTEENWAQKFEKSELRDEEFRRINFWRKVMRQAEQQLVSE